jgi:hypothetical protein
MRLRRLPFLLLSVAITVLAVTVPATATLVLSHSSLSPQSLPLVPLQDISVVARISVIPSGARTFATGHSLQMETDLSNARWSSVVFVDGIPADREGVEGRVMFISGFVLSYPTSRDVSLEVTVDGTVPEGVPEATLLMVRELDNTGTSVPGSTITITGPVLTPATVPATETFPETGTPSASSSPSPSPTRAGGFGWEMTLIGAGAVGAARRWYA